jgi:hypothetical protein
LETYFRPDLADDLTGFGLERPPTNIPPIRANENMAWFIFDTFKAAPPRLAIRTRRRARLTGEVPS